VDSALEAPYFRICSSQIKLIFYGFANFFKCEFNSKLSCRSAVFAYAHFHSASFGYSCLFNNTSFVGGANFTDSNFANSVDFGSVGFHGVTFFNLTAASSAAIPISFNATKFCKHPPHFFGRALHEDTDWTGVKLPNARSKTAQCECLRENAKRADDTVQMADKPRDSKAQAALPRHLLEHDKRAYEQLRIKCGALGKVEDEHMFFRREMELTGRLSPWYTRVTYWLYHLVSDYGYSYWRPIAGMGGAMGRLEPILRVSFHGPRPAASVHGRGRAFPQHRGPVFCEYFFRLWVLSAVSQ
jgi:hypothetical protein